MLGAALAYRLFIWMLPLTLVLVLVLGLGLWADESGSTTSAIVEDAGLTGFIAGSIAATAQDVQGWRAALGLGVGLTILVYVTYGLLRAVRAVTALAWRLPVRPPAHPARDRFLFLAWIVGFAAAASSALPIRARLELPTGLLLTIGVYAALPALFLALSWWLLPHTAERWTELVPASVLVACGLGLIGLFNTLVLSPWLAQKEETYGVLGVAAGLLFSFRLVGRTVELGAALNAVLSEPGRGRTLAR